MKKLVLSFEEMSGFITNAAGRSPSAFPFVTVPNFEVLGYHARLVTGVVMFIYNPIVTEKDVDKWNKYSVRNEAWIQEGRDYLRNLPDAEQPVLGIADEQDTQITPMIWRSDALNNAVPANPPPHTPIWQVCILSLMSLFPFDAQNQN